MEQKGNTRANFAWNMIGSVFESALSFVLLILVNRTVGETGGGVFTLAFSHAQLMYYLGTLEVRPIHSTDVREKYAFADYFSLRTVSCAVMIAASLGYVLLLDGDPVKKRIMMILCLYKMLDAFYDLFASMFQQHDRIAYSGQVSTLRVGLVLVGFAGVLRATGNLEAACWTMAGVSLTVLLTFNLARWRQFEGVPIRLQFGRCGEIVRACLPLFVSVFVMLYISNAPKYAIDRYCSDVVQNRYSILFMPAFVINLFSQFVLRPMLTPMAKLWAGGQVGPFRRNIGKMMAGIGLMTLLGMGGAWLLGIPILQMFYGVDLAGERNILMLVMFYGGLNAVNIFLYDMIAVTRNQKKQAGAYLIAAAAAAGLSPAMVQRWEMRGAIGASILALGLLDLMLTGIILYVLRRAERGITRGDEAAEG